MSSSYVICFTKTGSLTSYTSIMLEGKTETTAFISWNTINRTT